MTANYNAAGLPLMPSVSSADLRLVAWVKLPDTTGVDVAITLDVLRQLLGLPPQLAGTLAPQTGISGVAGSYTIPEGAVWDDKGTGNLTWSLVQPPAGVSISGRTVSWDETLPGGTYSLVIRVTDSDTNTLDVTLILVMAGANEAPVVAGTIPSLSGISGVANSWTIPQGFFTDDGGEQNLSYSLVSPPAGVSISGRVVSWTTALAGGVHSLVLRATDQGQPVKSATAVITLTMAGANAAPTVALSLIHI